MFITKRFKIIDIINENDAKDLKTFKLEFLKESDKKKYYQKFIPGQFSEIFNPGVGECPIGIASSPTEEDYLLFTIKKTGKVTGNLHSSKVGKQIGIRGPFGNGWPIEKAKGKKAPEVS